MNVVNQPDRVSPKIGEMRDKWWFDLLLSLLLYLGFLCIYKVEFGIKKEFGIELFEENSFSRQFSQIKTIIQHTTIQFYQFFVVFQYFWR